MKIAAIIGSIRQGAVGAQIGEWIASQAEAATEGHEGVELEVVNLSDYDLPLFEGPVPPMALEKNYDDECVTKWSQTIDAADAFLFVTPEYNHSVPAPFKNAVDSLGAEWSNKVVGFVGYSSSSGVRAVEHWRQILANFQMVDVRNSVDINLGAYLDSDGKFTPDEGTAGALKNVVGEIATLTAQLKK